MSGILANFCAYKLLKFSATVNLSRFYELIEKSCTKKYSAEITNSHFVSQL
jgi:hypothetical protein